MLTHIIRKEILSALASPKFVFAFLLCTVLILLSFYTGIASHKRDLAEYRSAVALSRKQLESHTSWTGLFFADAKLSKPPEILSTIVSGIQNAVGGNLLYNCGNDPGPVDSKYENNPASAIFGPLDLTLIVKIVLTQVHDQ